MIYDNEKRVVLTLDTAGDHFVFAALRGGRQVGDSISLPSEGHDLDKSLANIKAGFRALIETTGLVPSAISFPFPGPGDYPKGVIYNKTSLPAYREGVALADFLQDEFCVPVFINNDGDLFVYGEAIAGFLPRINKMFEQAGLEKRYKKLFGVTIGTGLGGGLVSNNRLFMGDNSNALEVWLTCIRPHTDCFAEEGASTRAVQRAYGRHAGLGDGVSLTGKEIEQIARGMREGDQKAALEAYVDMGHVLGGVCATAATLFDSLIVIGGGLSRAHDLFMDSVLSEMNGSIKTCDGREIPRLAQKAYNLEDPVQLEEFVRGQEKPIRVYGSDRHVVSDPLKRIGIGITTLGTRQAVAIGAYAYAVNTLDNAAINC